MYLVVKMIGGVERALCLRYDSAEEGGAAFEYSAPINYRFSTCPLGEGGRDPRKFAGTNKEELLRVAEHNV